MVWFYRDDALEWQSAQWDIPAKAICLAFFYFLFFLFYCQLMLPVPWQLPLLLGTWSSGIARYFWIVLGEECSNNAISDMVSPSLRFSWANFIRNDRFAVLYNAFISSVMLSVNGISTLAGNSRNIYLQITSESPLYQVKTVTNLYDIRMRICSSGCVCNGSIP